MSSTTKAIQVDARPEPLTLDPRSTAVIVVDMQNDFAAAGGMFDRAGIPVNAIQAIVDPTREVVETLIFTGATTSVCVESTLRDAFYRDYRCLLLSDCVAEPIGGQLPRTNHEASLLVVETLFGWVGDSRSLIEALERSRR